MVRLLCLENSSFNFWWSCCIRKTPQENTALSFCSCQCHVPELLVWGKKKHTSPLPRYISAFSQTISWPTSWCVIDWLLPAGGGSWPDCSRTQTPSVFTSLRITNVKSVYYSFCPQGGWAGEMFLIQLEFRQFTDSQFHRLPRTSFSCFYMSSLLSSLDQKRSVLFPINIKQSANLV